ncbi:biotin transporter BioY [Siccirubricoccus sp. KC 17139]|uniref:Biotin transporter n=1 Tax=Siccirubricoccus soli TaxID=2899147 RepID=A0ABT1DAY3_9PROT|nr:biotin transporter BioY [Siccirubricoccus soli]MCO6419098.1 biotin transporter BioY [Siccirubricoccus soli]MCP2685233.1 biotin transporter BioY [Siccirubricoccus soli]
MSLALAPSRSAARFWGFALLGSAVLAASAQISLPFWPVPATLQSLAVLLLGALGGGRLGLAAVGLYLLEGALGLPVFAGATAGPAVLTGPTAGYLLGFLPAAWIAGLAVRDSFPWRQAALLTLAHLALFLPGLLWLSGFVGLERAWMAGFLLFLPGTLVKTALAWAVLRAARR